MHYRIAVVGSGRRPEGTWKIEQQGEGVWVVRKGTEHHWASNAADAVALLVALEAAGR